MAEPSIESPSNPTPLLPRALEPDWALQELVQMANNLDGFQLSITLVSAGAIISGYLIGVREYYIAYGAQWRQGFGGSEIGKLIEARWVQLAEDTVVRPGTQIAQGTEPESAPQYLHLKDAHISFGSSMVPTDRGFLWRGRISEVAGYSIGMLGSPSERAALSKR